MTSSSWMIYQSTFTLVANYSSLVAHQLLCKVQVLALERWNWRTCEVSQRQIKKRLWQFINWIDDFHWSYDQTIEGSELFLETGTERLEAAFHIIDWMHESLLTLAYVHVVFEDTSPPLFVSTYQSLTQPKHSIVHIASKCQRKWT